MTPLHKTIVERPGLPLVLAVALAALMLPAAVLGGDRPAAETATAETEQVEETPDVEDDAAEDDAVEDEAAEDEAAGDEAAGGGDGWFSAEQIARGTQLYQQRCAVCHGDQILDDYSDWPFSAQALIDMIISMGMPMDNPGGLPMQDYTDIVAHILNNGGLPEGEEVLAGSPKLNEITLP